MFQVFKLKAFLKWFAIGVAAFALLLAGVLAFLQTGMGRNLLRSKVAAALSSGPDQQVRLGRIEGVIPVRMTLDRVQIRDRRGIWLGIDRLSLRWSPAALLRGRIAIAELGARQVNVYRLPQSPAQKPAKAAEPLQLPESIPPVSVADMHITRLRLEKAVTGRAAVFTLHGRVLETATHNGLKAALELRRVDAGPETELKASALLQGRPTTLGLQVAFREAAGGWVSRVAGLDVKGPLDFTVDGTGPLDRWHGVVGCRAGTWGTLRSELDLHYSREVRLALQAKVIPGAQLVPKTWRPLLGPETSLDLQADFLPSRYLRVKKLQVRGAGYEMTADAALDLPAETVHGQLHLGVNHLQAAEGAAGVPLAGRLTLQGTVSGPWRQPLGALSLQLHNLKVATVAAETVATTLKVEPTGTSTSDFGGMHVTASGHARGLHSLSGEPLPEKALEWSMEAGVSPQRQLSLTRFVLSGTHETLLVNGRFDPVKSLGNLTATLNITDLRGLSSLVGETVAGTAGLKVHVIGQGEGPSAQGRIEGFVRPTAEAKSPVSTLLSPEFKFSTDLNLQQGSHLSVTNLQAASKAFQFSSRAQMDLAAKTLQGDWQLTVDDLQPFGALAGKPMAGSLRADGTVKGPLQSLQATARVQGSRVHFDKATLDRVLLTFESKNLPATPQGKLRLELVQRKAKLLFSTRFFRDRHQLGLNALRLQAPGAELHGDLKLDLQTSLLQGQVTGRLQDLSGIGRFTGQDLRGSGDLRAGFRGSHGSQDVELLLTARNLSTPAAKISRLRLAANLKNVLKSPRGSADLKLSGLRSATAKIDTFTLRAAGDERGMRFQAAAKGDAGSAFDLRTRGVAVHTKSADRLEVDTLQGRFGSYPVKLFRTASLERSGDRLSVTGLDVGFGSGRLRVSGRWAAPKVMLDLSVTDWPLAAAALLGGPELQGTAAGELRASGTADSPELQLQLHVTGLHSADPTLQGVPPATVLARVRLQKRLLHLQASLQGPVKEPARLELQMPLKVSLDPFAFAVPTDARLRGQINAKMDLSNVSKMLLWDTQEMSGQAVADLRIGGSPAAPRLDGRVKVSNGGYENYVSGTILKDLNLDLEARGPQLVIAALRATDGGKGSLSGSGRVELDAANHFPMELKLALNHATLVRRDDVTGTANGQVELAGSLQKLAVTGKLEVTPVEVNIPDRLPAEMTDLKVIEINTGKTAPAAAPKQPQAAAPPVQIGLNLGIDLPRRIFVRGRGLDSEWEGKLRIGGTAQNPAITGKIEVVRGRFNFLNRRFKLTTGTITFYGGSPPSPNLNLTADAEVTDMTARLVLSGSVDNPKLELQSTPPLASDEILARLLFRRSTAELSPTQALKLASALRQLTGKGGGGFNLMDRTRKLLGLDELDFQGSDQGFGKGTVGVGKYLSDNVYLNLQKGIGEKTDKATVEVEITPHISVESQVQSDSSSGIGINWKYDY